MSTCSNNKCKPHSANPLTLVLSRPVKFVWQIFSCHRLEVEHDCPSKTELRTKTLPHLRAKMVDSTCRMSFHIDGHGRFGWQGENMSFQGTQGCVCVCVSKQGNPHKPAKRWFPFGFPSKQPLNRVPKRSRTREHQEPGP